MNNVFVAGDVIKIFSHGNFMSFICRLASPYGEGYVYLIRAEEEKVMALLKVDLDRENLERLAEIAVNERRPISLQAEVLLMRAIAAWHIPELWSEPIGIQEKDG